LRLLLSQENNAVDFPFIYTLGGCMKARKKVQKGIDEVVYGKEMTREKRRKFHKNLDEDDEDFDWESYDDWDNDFPEFKH